MIVRLPSTIHVKGLGKPTESVLVKSEGDICLYKRNDDIYEIFKVRIRRAEVAFGKEYPEREIYPSNEDFGEKAWCYLTLEDATKKYNELRSCRPPV